MEQGYLREARSAHASLRLRRTLFCASPSPQAGARRPTRAPHAILRRLHLLLAFGSARVSLRLRCTLFCGPPPPSLWICGLEVGYCELVVVCGLKSELGTETTRWMPPEPPPLDRKDFLYKDRKHDRGGNGDAIAAAGGGGGSTPRWRDPPPPPPPLRDYSRPSPRRTPSSSSAGYYRQGGGGYDRSYPDEQNGYTPSRSDRYWQEDDGHRNFGRYGGSNRSGGRDGRGSYRRSPFRTYSSDFPRNHQEQQQRLPEPAGKSPLRSVAVPISSSHDAAGDKSGGDRDREHQQPRVTPWRPLRRRDGRSEAADAGVGPGAEAPTAAPLEKEASARSSAAAASAAPRMAEDDAPRKKARLGWGQGLAKYEKQKVQGPAEAAPDNVANGGPTDAEHKAAEHVPVGCPSPVSAPSPAQPCSSSPVAEDKSCENTGNCDAEPSKEIVPGVETKDCNSEVPIRLDQLDGDPVGALATFLADLLQHEDACSEDSTFTRLTDMNKLLLLKENISKELEKTELEIDSLEGELKSVDVDAGNKAPQDSRIACSDAQNPSSSPSVATSKNSASTENHEMISCLKESGDPLPSPKGFFEQDAEVKDVEMMDVKMVSSNDAKTASSEERAACSGIAEMTQTCGVDGGSLKASEGNGLLTNDGQERLEATSCRVNVNSVETDGSCDFSIRPCSHGDTKSNLIPLIIAANKDAAKGASELVVKTLPTDPPQLDLWALSRVSDYRKNDLRIKEKLVVCKNRVRFKEQVLTFKFKALHHLWKEDVRLLSVRKQRTKSNKRTDPSNRASQNGSQKQRSSNRSRFTLPAGNLSLLPAMEMTDVASKLLSEFQVKCCTSNLKMPALIIDEKEKNAKFVSKNGLIEDPVSVEKEKTMINPWTHEEKEIFMEMLATFGKDFSKISSFLDHKTTADCIEFYYKHHKSDSFREVKKRLDLRKQRQCLPTSNYLARTSGKKWNPETNAAPLDMLGAATVVAAHGLGCPKRVEKNSAKFLVQTTHVPDIPYATKVSFDRERGGKISLHERESVAADVLAGICGTLSSEAMGSCITSSVDPVEKMNFVEMERRLKPEVNQSFDEDDTCSDEGCGEVESVDWTDDEKSIFLQAVNKYGKDFARISSCVKSKSYEQCKIFFSKARKSLGLDMVHQGTADVGMFTSDTNGGRSDTDEACAAEMDSAICSTQSCSKMDADVSPSAADGTMQRLVLAGSSSIPPETVILSEQDVVGGINVEESDSKMEKNNNILGDDKQFNGGVLNQGASGPIDINCNESIQIPQDIENIGTETNMHDGSAVVSTAEQAAATSSEIRSNLHTVEAIQPNNACGGISVEGSRKEGSPHHVAESGSTKPGNLAGSFCFAAEGGAKENGIHLSNVAGVSSRPAFAPSYQHKVPVDLLPSKPKPQVTPLTKKDLLPVQFNSVLPDPTSICFEGITSKTTLNFEDHGNKFSRSSGAKDLNQCPSFKDSSINQLDALLQNTNEYTLQRWNLKDIKGGSDHLVTEVPHFSESHTSSNVGISQANQFFLANVQNGKSSSSSLSNSSTGMLWTRNGEERSEGPLRLCSSSASPKSEERFQRPGDVKIFGKILSHQSSLQSSGSSSNDSKSKPPSPKIDRLATRSSNNSKDRVVCSSRPGTSGHLGLEERPTRSYGYWDGSRIQTGIPSLHESALMLAKCHRSLAGVPFYSAKNGTLSSNIMLAEYQQPLMQQLASDAKRLESFADLQKRNGIELVSGFQQSGKGARLGGPGILVSGASDPVAALKMHYASSAKILSNDMEPWRGGDIGGR